MAIYGITKQQYDNFLKSGGVLVATIDAEEICWSKNFENFNTIKPNLYTGFEMPPLNLTESKELLAHVFSKPGNDWDKLIAVVYLANGKIVYKKLQGGKY